MTCLVRYTTEENGNQIYTITASTAEEAQGKLKSFLEHNNLQENQITIEMISAN